MSALENLEAVLLLTKHLDILLPFLVALRRLSEEDVRRLPMLQQLARDIAVDREVVEDWYRALELMTGQDLSNRSVVDVLKLSVENLSPKNEAVGDLWRAAYHIGLVGDPDAQRWVLYEGLSDGSSDGSGRR